MIGFAIGNGSTRKGFDLKRLDGCGATAGCNMIVREYVPDVVVGLDVNMRFAMRRIKGYPWKFLTRHDLKHIFTLDGKMIGRWSDVTGNWMLFNNSGVVAVWYLAEKLKCETVYMIGYDFWSTPDAIDGSTRPLGTMHKMMSALAARTDARLIRVGPRHDKDAELWDEKLQGIEYLDSFEDMPLDKPPGETAAVD